MPFYIISPWTRGGNVYVEHADHNSQIMFVEKWLASKGKNVKTTQMNPWRRANMADLTKAFDFQNPDYSIPSMPNVSYPSTDAKGSWNGYALCEAKYGSDPRPPVPYGKQTEATALQTEQGFKQMRGNPTEGRYLTFEMNGYALTNDNHKLTAAKASPSHNVKAQRFILHQSGSGFSVTSAVDAYTVNDVDALKDPSSAAKTYAIIDLGNGQGYAIGSNGQYLTLSKSGKLGVSKTPGGFNVFSVTYDN